MSAERTVFMCSASFEDPVADEVGEKFYTSAAACLKGQSCIGSGPHDCRLVKVTLTCLQKFNIPMETTDAPLPRRD